MNNDYVDPLLEEAIEAFPEVPVDEDDGPAYPVANRAYIRASRGGRARYRMPRRLPRKTGEWMGRYEHEEKDLEHDGKELVRDADGKPLLDRFAIASLNRGYDRYVYKENRRLDRLDPESPYYDYPVGTLNKSQRMDRYARQAGDTWVMTPRQARRIRKKHRASQE